MNIINDPTYQWSYNSDLKNFVRKKNNEETIYTFGKELGQGTFGTVYELIPNRDDKKIKAVKVPRGWGNFENEYNISKNLPGSEGLQKPPKAFLNQMLVLPKYDGVLSKILPKLTVSEKLEVMKQLINGLAVLHDKGISHNDLINPNNFMYRKTKDGKMHYAIIDFGNINYDSFINDIHSLGMKIQDIVFQDSDNYMTNFEILEETSVTERGFPPPLTKVINFMNHYWDLADESWPDYTMESVKKIFSEIDV